ncbi:MAG: DNA/RNA nuclease SfsA [Pseudomonadales bacterium]
MKFATALTPAILLRRYKRFLADVTLENGDALTVHCPNTGAMTGCDKPGSRAWLVHSNNAKRKYAYSLEQVLTEAGRVGVNTARANALIKEALTENALPELRGYAVHKSEAAIPSNNSANPPKHKGRFDFLLSQHEGKLADCYVEVKSVTLAAQGGVGLFPDAVSARALKHVMALQMLLDQGLRAVLVFCVQHDGISRVSPADQVDPEYAAALRAAANSGVEVLAYRAQMSATMTVIDASLPVVL